MAKHVRVAATVRGRLTVAQELDGLRHRTVLVARLVCSSSVKPAVQPLYDVTLVASTGECWTLAGFERIEAGPLRHVHFVGQSWIVEPAAIQDLIDAELKWSTASGRAHALEQQLTNLRFIPDSSKTD